MAKTIKAKTLASLGEIAAIPVPAGTAAPLSVEALKQDILATFLSFERGSSELREAKDKAKLASETALGSRGGAVLSLAALSHKHGLVEDTIDAAVAQAVAEYSKQDKKKEDAIAVFARDVKLAMNHRVRARVPAIFALVDAAWKAEDDALTGDADAPTPVQSKFKRTYHGAIRLMRAAAKGETIPATVGELTAYAENLIEDERVRVNRLMRKLASIIETLKEFHEIAPIEEIHDCVEYLETITADDIKKAHTQPARIAPKKAAPAATIPGKKASEAKSVKPAPAAVVAPAPAPAVDEDDMLAMAAPEIDPAAMMQQLQAQMAALMTKISAK